MVIQKNGWIARVGVFLLLIAMYSIGTVSAIKVSWTYTLILLILSAVLLTIYNLSNRGRYLSKISLIWLILTILCCFGVLQGSLSAVLIFYILGLVILLMSESIGLDNFISNLKWMKWFGLFFSLGCYWQFLFSDQYYEKLYPLFGVEYQLSIRRQFYFHKMCTGFTSQTAVATEFIILGLMAAIYTFSQNKNSIKKKISLFEIVFLIGGLLLTGKRSPLLNIGIAFVVVDMLTVKRNKKATRFITIMVALLGISVLLYVLAPMILNSRNSIVRLLEFTNSEDVGDFSNGRFALYESAIDEFNSHPIFGIGWGKFGPANNVTGVHNIYLQLLCECGIFGFVFAIIGMLYSLFASIKLLKISSKKDSFSETCVLLKCSVFIQLYILVYGLFGNPIYDQNYIIMYLLGLLISCSIYFRIDLNDS